MQCNKRLYQIVNSDLKRTCDVEPTDRFETCIFHTPFESDADHGNLRGIAR